jgi:hypothetical protein
MPGAMILQTRHGSTRKSSIGSVGRSGSMAGISSATATCSGSGELISGFMKRIGLADHVIVVLSDKYLRSPYCMAELYSIYQRSVGEKEDFLRRIIPLRLEDARFGAWRDRVAYAEYWEAEFKAMEEKFRHLAESDFRPLTPPPAHNSPSTFPPPSAPSTYPGNPATSEAPTHIPRTTSATSSWGRMHLYVHFGTFHE